MEILLLQGQGLVEPLRGPPVSHSCVVRVLFKVVLKTPQDVSRHWLLALSPPLFCLNMPSRPRYTFREQSLGLGRTFCSSGAEISVWTANEKVTWDTSSLPWTTKGKAPRSPTCNRLGEPLATDQLWLRPLTPAQLAWPPGLCELNYYSMIRTCYFIALYLGLLQLQCRNRRHSTKVTGRGSASAEPLLAAWHLFRTQYACCCC